MHIHTLSHMHIQYRENKGSHFVKGDEGFMKLALTLEGAFGGRENTKTLVLLTDFRIKAYGELSVLCFLIFCHCLHHDYYCLFPNY